MNVAIHIYPNVGEDWTASSPIENVEIDDHLILPAGRSPSTATSGTVVYGRLKGVSPIDRGVSILENRGLDSTDFKGVGGISKTGDFTVTLIDADESLDMYKLLGRTIKICLLEDGASSLNYADNDCMFVGYVKNVEPSSNFELILTVADPVARTLSQTIGTEIDTDKIIPINYGDFTSEAAKMSAVYKDGKVYVDSETLESIDNLHVFDDTLKEFYGLDGELVTDGKEIELTIETDIIKLVASMTDYVRLVSLYNPYSRAYLPNLEVSDLVVGDVYSYTNGGDTVHITLLKIKDGYLVFDDPSSHDGAISESSETGTLTRVSGSGTASITYSFRSAAIVPLLYYEADSYHFDGSDATLPLEDAGRSLTMGSPASRCLLKIDDEIVQIVRHGTHAFGSNNDYSSTSYYVIRAVEGTTASSHTVEAVCSVLKDDNSFSEVLEDLYSKNKYTFGHTFKVESVSGVSYVDTDGDIVKTQFGDGFFHGDLNKIGEEGSRVEINSLSTISGGSPGNVTDKSRLVFEIKFPKVGLPGTVIDMFFRGAVTFNFQDLAAYANTLTANLHLLIGKGGGPVPIWLGSYPGFCGWFKQDPNLIYVGKFDSLSHYTNSLTDSYPCLHLSRTYGSLHVGLPNSAFNIVPPKIVAIASELRQTTGSDPTQIIRRQWFNNVSEGYTPLKAYSLSPYADSLANGLIDSLEDLNVTKYFLTVMRENIAGTGITDAVINQSIYLSGVGLHILFAVDLSTIDVFVSGKGRVTPELSWPINYPQDILKDLLAKEYSLNATAYDCWATWQTFDFNTTLSLSGARDNFFDKLDDFCKKHCLMLTYNRLGSILLTSCLPELANPPELSNVLSQLTITNAEIIPDNWSQSYTSVDGLMKSLTLKYAQRKSDEVYTAETESAAYSNQFGAINESVLEHPFIYEQASAEWLVEKLLDFYRRPVREIKTKVQLGYYQIGAWVTIDSDYLPKTKNNKYLLTNTVDCLPVDSEPYTELTLLELINPSQTDVLPFNSTITEIGEGVINETSSDSIITES